MLNTPPVNIPDQPRFKTVIDTQVVMDWLVFRNPAIEPLVKEVLAGRLQWLGVPAMKEELLHVLGRGVARKYEPNLDFIQAMFEQHCNMVQTPPPPAVRLVCRDKDDQMFIDLALSASARWLISRDRAVLALSKRAAKCGVEILTPEKWIQRQLGAMQA